MPYFIYRVSEPKHLEYLDAKDGYQEAKSAVREFRARQGSGDGTLIRMIFAKTTGEAEKLLSVPRDDRVIGED